jgi:hypothetical protein
MAPGRHPGRGAWPEAAFAPTRAVVSTFEKIRRRLQDRPDVVPVSFGGTNEPFDVSRDGRLLATTNAVHVSSEIWVLEPHP